MSTEKKIDSAANLSVEDRLKTLYRLQTILTKIDHIRDIRGELPLEVQELNDTIKGLETRIKNFEGDIATLQEELNAQRRKIDNSRMLIERYNEQLGNVSNNHEFDQLTKEIEFENLQIKLAEKKIRETGADIDRRNGDITATEEKIADQNHILTEKKNELDNIVSETRQEEEVLLGEAKDLEQYIDERTLAAFKRIRKNARNGLGIVTVDREACGGCFNRIPPQRQMEIKLHKKVIVCEYCGRIMIDPALVADQDAE